MVVHLIERHYDGDLAEAVRGAYKELEGHFAFVVVHHDHPGELVGARLQCPLLVGVGRGEMFLASMAAAFIAETREIQLIEDGEVVTITEAGARFLDVEDGEVEREVIEVDWGLEEAEKSGYETFMLKEIYEQPEAVAETLGDRIRHGELVLESLGHDRRASCATCAGSSSLRAAPPTTRRCRPLHDRGVGAASRSSPTSPASGSTATRCSRRTRW